MKYHTFISTLFFLQVLSGCTNPQQPINFAAHPIYVFSGQHAVPGNEHAQVTALDRKTFAPIGTRTLELSYINEALFDGSRLWYGYAGDIDVDMNTVAQLSTDLSNESVYKVCTEPNGVHNDGDSLIVLCTQNGMIAHATRIRKGDGAVEAEADIVTKWGDMMYIDSVLFNGELIVYGGGHYADFSDRTAQELQVRDPKTLQLIRVIETPKTELGMKNFIVMNKDLYILNMASKYAAVYGFLPVDVLRYHSGSAKLESLPLIARSPHDGIIIGEYLYTLHNTYDNYDGQTVSIYKTNLKTWKMTHWDYDGEHYMHLNDMQEIDGKIILALFQSHQPAREGIYELNTTTGALDFRTFVPGASLIIDTNS